MFAPSKYQQAFFDWTVAGTGSAILGAVAGSGKTTTIVKALDLIDPNLRTTFLAFNKKIATELASRVPKHVQAATFHSVGFAAWRRASRKSPVVNGNKVRDLLKRYYSEDDQAAYGPFMLKMVAAAKSAGIGELVPDTLESWVALADHYGHELDNADAEFSEGLRLSSALLADSTAAADAGEIDFDDMLYMPLIRNVTFPQNDWLFVDESQDVNAVQLALLRRMLAPGGRLVAVGDPNQAIYGFRGALSSSMSDIAKAFGCAWLPLSVCYRCAQSIVKLAQSVVPSIEFSDAAPVGEIVEGAVLNAAGVVYRDEKDAEQHIAFRPEDVIICRNSAPLVQMAYALIGRKIACKVLGREIGAGLTSLVKAMKPKGLDALLSKLAGYAERECAKFMSKGQEQRAEAVRDKVECIVTIASHLDENHRTVPELIRTIEALFSDDAGKSILTLCTVHKSKGLEWDRVFLYRPELMPSKYARQDWQKEQEKNLQYVAYTRARASLVFVGV